MVEPITDPALRDEIVALTRHAAEVVNEHANDHGWCAVCGDAFPCERAILAEHNLAF
jgi:hypothetical protein